MSTLREPLEDSEPLQPSTPLNQIGPLDMDLPDTNPLTGMRVHNAASPARQMARNDEATVEAALHAFLYAITMRFLKTTPSSTTVAEWSHKHLYLKCGRWVAITDGLLKAANGQTRAIVEVKPLGRKKQIGFIRAQEAGQMAAWIHTDPNAGMPSGKNDGTEW